MTTTEKQHIEEVKASITKRLSAPSPDLFIKIQKWCIFGGIACGGLSSYFLSINAESKIGLVLATFGGFLATVGTILAKLPVDSEKTIEKLKK